MPIMSPHNDAPSPASSFTAGFNKFPFMPSAPSGLMLGGDFTPAGTESPLSSSYSSSSLGSADVGDVVGAATAAGFHLLPRRPLVPGVYVPTMCFFDPDTEDVDVPTIAEHAVRLARAGVAGLATQGSNGEAVHLTHAERKLVTAATRKALDDAGFGRMPVVVGCGSQSTRETVQFCREAWETGGDYALVLPPSYYAPLFSPGSRTVVDYFVAVADASPIPLIIYNFPGAVNGMDLSSDVILELAAHPNIVGVKLTCGNTGKLQRVAAGARKLAAAARAAATKNQQAATVPNSASAPAPQATDSGSSSVPDFLVLAGSADFTVQSLVAGGHGILAGLANIAPRACVETVRLWAEGRHTEAQALQEVLADGDWTAIQGGVVGVKSGLQSWMGYGGYARSPLPRPSVEQVKKWREGYRELVMLEESL